MESLSYINHNPHRLHGFATHGSTQRLGLLSPKAPDAHADMGRRKFKYAIVPHRGVLNQSAVVRAVSISILLFDSSMDSFSCPDFLFREPQRRFGNNSEIRGWT